MDGRRFDGIARTWAGGANRRAAVRAFAALVLGGNALRAAPPAAAQDALDTPCASNADCRGAIPDQCVRSHCWRGRCAFAAVRCAAGYHCCGNGRCCQDTVDPACVADADCVSASAGHCVRFHCENGFCISMVVDCAPGYACCGAGECCPTL